MSQFTAFADRLGLADPTLVDAVLAVSRMPYRRPSTLSPAGVVQEWRGTCSTKHALLMCLMTERWPDLEPTMWHRVYLVTPDHALSVWGESVARTVPTGGLVDVHSYVTARMDGATVIIDATFPVPEWDGRTSLPIWAAPGTDVVAGPDPLAHKRTLERDHCDSVQREPFIAAIVEAQGNSDRSRP